MYQLSPSWQSAAGSLPTATVPLSTEMPNFLLHHFAISYSLTALWTHFLEDSILTVQYCLVPADLQFSVLHSSPLLTYLDKTFFLASLSSAVCNRLTGCASIVSLLPLFLTTQQVYCMLTSSNNTALQPQVVCHADEKCIVSHHYVA